jgi:cysteine desulfurase
MKFIRRNKKRIYLDYAAATPMRQSVCKSMRRFESELFANASAIHSEGVASRNAIDTARLTLARLLKIRPNGIVFTGSGTESNNLAILGVVQAQKKKGVPYTDMEVISTRIEHPSVVQTLQHLENIGVTVRYLDVDEEGVIVTGSLQEALTEKTILVSFAYVNSEVGTVQEVGRLTRIIRAFAKTQHSTIVIHLDAAQAPLWLPCELERLNADIITLDAGKCYGPKGVGVLAMRHGVQLSPVLYGGSQEGGLRPATENTAGIVGAVEALVCAQEGVKDRVKKVTALRDMAIKKLLDIQGVVLNGSTEHRAANNINISIPGIDSEFAVISLDIAGVSCSTKSACSGADGSGSSVVFAMTNDSKRASSTIRFTLGEETTSQELIKTTDLVRIHVEKMKRVTTELTRT